MRSLDGLLHVLAGQTVRIFGPGNLDTPGPLHAQVAVARAPSTPAPDISSLWFHTQATAYDLRILPATIQIEIPFSFTNRSGQTLYYNSCQPVFPEQWALDRWRRAFSVACILILKTDSLRPGQILRDTLRISSARVPRNFPRFAFDPIPGVYRLRYYLWTRGGDPLPLSHAVSNNFTVRAP